MQFDTQIHHLPAVHTFQPYGFAHIQLHHQKPIIILPKRRNASHSSII